MEMKIVADLGNYCQTPLFVSNEGYGFGEAELVVELKYFGEDNGPPLSAALGIAASSISATGNLIVLGAMAINIPVAVYLMKLFQFTSFLGLINLKFPQNLEDFFGKFRLNLFNFLEF